MNLNIDFKHIDIIIERVISLEKGVYFMTAFICILYEFLDWYFLRHFITNVTVLWLFRTLAGLIIFVSVLIWSAKIYRLFACWADKKIKVFHYQKEIQKNMKFYRKIFNDLSDKQKYFLRKFVKDKTDIILLNNAEYDDIVEEINKELAILNLKLSQKISFGRTKVFIDKHFYNVLCEYFK